MKTLIALAFLLLSAVDGKNTTAFPVIGDVVPIVHMLTLCSFTLTLTVVVRSLVIYYNCPVPSVIIIYAVGVLIGFAMEFTDVFIAYEDVIYDLDSNMLLNSVLPLMVFKVAFCLDAHTFVRAWLQIVLVAIPGVLITAFIVGLVEMAILNLELHWTLLMGLIFGIVATPIYPFEVVKVLKEVEKSKHLSILLEGESMLGTGFCIVLFHIVLGAYRQNITDWYQFVFVFVRLCGGGKYIP